MRSRGYFVDLKPVSPVAAIFTVQQVESRDVVRGVQWPEVTQQGRAAGWETVQFDKRDSGYIGPIRWCAIVDQRMCVFREFGRNGVVGVHFHVDVSEVGDQRAQATP